MRIALAVGILVALGFPAPAVAQDAPPLQRPPESTLSGSVRLEFFGRDASIEDLRARLLGIPPRGRDETFFSVDSRIRLDLRLPDVRFAAELAMLPYDDGANSSLGQDGLDLLLKQLFIDLEHDSLTFRLGAFDYAWRIRPHGEPFLLDLGRAESFFTGPGDRDLSIPAGALLKWDVAGFVEVEGLWMTAIEGGSSSSDESLAGLLVNFPLSERTAFFLGALHVSGDGDPRVTTWGGGLDAYFLPERELEVFGEGWLQSGRIASGVSRRAWGAHTGARIVTGPWRGEVSGAWRSGDDDPADSRDESFQSYEGQERFRIVESAEFGLDWDVNVTSMRFSIARRIGDSSEARIDAGRFRLAESTPGFERDLGTEIDATYTHELSKAVTIWVALAALLGSDTLDEDGLLLGAAGIRAVW